jgi:hypothetical protein
MAHVPVLKRDPRVEFIDYSWLISGVLYQGGMDLLIPELQTKGINEVYFYNVAGSPIGKKMLSGVASSFDVEEFFVVVAADQAENVFDFIYHFCELDKPNMGMLRLNKLSRSTLHSIADGDAEDAKLIEHQPN